MGIDAGRPARAKGQRHQALVAVVYNAMTPMTPKQVRRSKNKVLRHCGIEGRKLTDAQVGEAFGLLNETIETVGAKHRAALRRFAAVCAAHPRARCDPR